MFKFNDLKISGKIISLMAMLAVVAIGIAAFSSLKLMEINTKYTALTEHSTPALINSIRTNHELSELNSNGYQAIAFGAGSAQGKEAAGAEAEALKAGEAHLQEAKRLEPGGAAAYDGFLSRLKEIGDTTQKSFDRGLANDSVGAIREMVTADALITKLSEDLIAFNNAEFKKDQDIALANGAAVMGAIFSVAIFGGLGVFLALGAGMWISNRMIARPLIDLSGLMTNLAGGDLAVDVVGQDRKDEVGMMAKSVQVFKENGLKARELTAEADKMRADGEAERGRNEAEQRKIEAEQAMVVTTLAASLGRMAKGELTARIDAEFEGQYAQIKTDFNAAIDSMREAMIAINTSTGGIRGGASEIGQASDDLSRRTEQQAASLEETAAALDEITATVRTTAEGANHARDVVATARADAEQSATVVREAVAAMSEIEKSAQQISQIIGVIDEIAFQTNLLALNAGVEAARAGDAGRGFAVVASEVRALAQRSADAAKEIKTLISDSSRQVGEGVKLVGETGTALERIQAQVVDISTVIAQIAASAQEQASGLAEVNIAVNQMDQVTQQNAAMVEQATAAAHSLNQETDELVRLVGAFDVGAPSAAAPARAPKAAAKPALKTVAASPRAGGAARKPAESTDTWEEF